MASKVASIHAVSGAVSGRGGPQLESHDRIDLHELYGDLSRSLDQIHEQLTALHSVGERVCLTVLEDDVTDLLDECGNMLVSDGLGTTSSIRSLETRTVTVLEEVRKVLFVDSKEIPN